MVSSITCRRPTTWAPGRGLLRQVACIPASCTSSRRPRVLRATTPCTGRRKVVLLACISSILKVKHSFYYYDTTYDAVSVRVAGYSLIVYFINICPLLVCNVSIESSSILESNVFFFFKCILEEAIVHISHYCLVNCFVYI
jgi:hypothetical protein